MTRRRDRLRRVCAAACVAITIGASLSGCGTDVAGLPVPGMQSSDGTYPVHIQFSNVLNLPSGAPVVANGVEIGSLTGLRVDDGGFVVADVAIDDGVALPTATTAMLRQSAPLADVHIALTTPTTGSSRGNLEAGSTIPLQRTSEAPQIEDTLAGLATAVGNGTFTNFMTTVRQMNKAFPDDTRRTARMFDVIGRDLDDLAAHQNSITKVLDGMNATTRRVIEEKPKIDPLLTAQGVSHTTSAMKSVLGIIFILTDLGQIAPPAQWLAPMLGASDRAVSAVMPMLFSSNPLDTTEPSNLRRLTDLLHDDLIPFAASGAKVDITTMSVTGRTGKLSATGQSAQMIQALRMIGLVR
ncbi:MCE family protein [Streptomyces sp. SID6673]|nr:MCE family protein [Streptomyces sp. SID11726]NEB24211.1 MCE family protein [Streptomyces sp. SID6673]